MSAIKLEHLAFVEAAATKSVAAAGSLFSGAKTRLPSAAAPLVAAVEERASPLLAFAADTAGGALVTVDKKVGERRGGEGGGPRWEARSRRAHERPSLPL